MIGEIILKFVSIASILIGVGMAIYGVILTGAGFWSHGIPVGAGNAFSWIVLALGPVLFFLGFGTAYLGIRLLLRKRQARMYLEFLYWVWLLSATCYAGYLLCDKWDIARNDAITRATLAFASWAVPAIVMLALTRVSILKKVLKGG